MKTEAAGRFILSGVIVAVILISGALALSSIILNGGRIHSANAAHFGGPFSLIDQNGATVTQAQFTGRPMVLFFGYTHCQDVCTTALADMSQWQADLGTAGASLPFVFVTVDPERDTPAVMHDYLQNFPGRFTALSGSAEAVRSMLGAYHVINVPVSQQDGSYDMDHTGAIFLINGDGSLAGTITSYDDQKVGLAKIRQFLAAQKA